MTEEKKAEIFEFLEELRESGTTNMLGATPYIFNAFDITESEARKVLVDWMNSKTKS